MQKKVLILGSSGMIGHQLFYYLKENSSFQLFDISHRLKIQEDTILLDALNYEKLAQEINKISPNYIINCIGILIGESNKNPKNAIFFNAYLPHFLASVADEVNSKFIHISTDCVFSGLKKSPYIESDQRDGYDIYAKTKGLGEVVDNNHLTIRTSVVGPELNNSGTSLFHWFMDQKNEVEGYTKTIWSGVTSIELSKAVKWCIDNDIKGLYHVTNNKSINKHDLLKLFKEFTLKDIIINSVAGDDVDKSFIDTRKEIEYELPDYDYMIKKMIMSIRDSKQRYKHYNI
jgi:dTDP-4-dehydrorhamnose reductase